MKKFTSTPLFSKKKRVPATRPKKGKPRRLPPPPVSVAMVPTGRSREVRAPVAEGTQRVGGYGLSFSAAPFEDTLGEGVRIRAKMLSDSVKRLAAGSPNRTNQIFTGYSGTTSAVCTALSSSFSTATGTAYDCFPIWNNGATNTPLHTFVALFAKYSVRQMSVTWVPRVATNLAGSIAFGSVFETGTPEEITFTDISSLNRSVRTPLWKPATLVAIADRDLQSPAPRLFDTASSIAQFQIIGAVDDLPVSGDTIGNFEFSFLIDLYQFKKTAMNAGVESKETKSLEVKSFEGTATPMKCSEQGLVVDDAYVLTPSASSSSASNGVCATLTSKVGKVLRA